MATVIRGGLRGPTRGEVQQQASRDRQQGFSQGVQTGLNIGAVREQVRQGRFNDMYQMMQQLGEESVYGTLSSYLASNPEMADQFFKQAGFSRQQAEGATQGLQERPLSLQEKMRGAASRRFDYVPGRQGTEGPEQGPAPTTAPSQLVGAPPVEGGRQTLSYQTEGQVQGPVQAIQEEPERETTSEYGVSFAGRMDNQGKKLTGNESPIYLAEQIIGRIERNVDQEERDKITEMVVKESDKFGLDTADFDPEFISLLREAGWGTAVTEIVTPVEGQAGIQGQGPVTVQSEERDTLNSVLIEFMRQRHDMEGVGSYAEFSDEQKRDWSLFKARLLEEYKDVIEPVYREDGSIDSERTVIPPGTEFSIELEEEVTGQEGQQGTVQERGTRVVPVRESLDQVRQGTLSPEQFAITNHLTGMNPNAAVKVTEQYQQAEDKVRVEEQTGEVKRSTVTGFIGAANRLMRQKDFDNLLTTEEGFQSVMGAVDSFLGDPNALLLMGLSGDESVAITARKQLDKVWEDMRMKDPTFVEMKQREMELALRKVEAEVMKAEFGAEKAAFDRDAAYYRMVSESIGEGMKADPQLYSALAKMLELSNNPDFKRYTEALEDPINNLIEQLGGGVGIDFIQRMLRAPKVTTVPLGSITTDQQVAEEESAGEAYVRELMGR